MKKVRKQKEAVAVIEKLEAWVLATSGRGHAVAADRQSQIGVSYSKSREVVKAVRIQITATAGRTCHQKGDVCPRRSESLRAEDRHSSAVCRCPNLDVSVHADVTGLPGEGASVGATEQIRARSEPRTRQEFQGRHANQRESACQLEDRKSVW